MKSKSEFCSLIGISHKYNSPFNIQQSPRHATRNFLSIIHFFLLQQFLNKANIYEMSDTIIKACHPKKLAKKK